MELAGIWKISDGAYRTAAHCDMVSSTEGRKALKITILEPERCRLWTGLQTQKCWRCIWPLSPVLKRICKNCSSGDTLSFCCSIRMQGHSFSYRYEFALSESVDYSSRYYWSARDQIPPGFRGDGSWIGKSASIEYWEGKIRPPEYSREYQWIRRDAFSKEPKGEIHPRFCGGGSWIR